jgi:biopolymer transport protein ExbD
MLKFSTAGGFGVPNKKLKSWLNLPHNERNKVVTEGIPCDTVNNELGPWIHNARLAQFNMKQQGVVDAEYVIVIKADQGTPYPMVQKVINTLTDINVNKFNLITSMEADPNKKPEEAAPH